MRVLVVGSGGPSCARPGRFRRHPGRCALLRAGQCRDRRGAEACRSARTDIAGSSGCAAASDRFCRRRPRGAGSSSGSSTRLKPKASRLLAECRLPPYSKARRPIPRISAHAPGSRPPPLAASAIRPRPRPLSRAMGPDRRQGRRARACKGVTVGPISATAYDAVDAAALVERRFGHGRRRDRSSRSFLRAKRRASMPS